MKRWKEAAVMVALAGVGLGAHAGPYGVVFTNESDDTIKLWQGGSLSTLVSFADPSVRLGGITRASVNGKWYVANGPIVPTETSASIYEIDDIFAPAPTVNVLTSGNPSQNPIHLRWDAARNVLMSVNNPGTHPLDPLLDGVLAYHLDGSTTTVWSEPEPAGAPSYFDGVWMTPIADGSGDYLVVAGNGGAFGGPGNAYSATLWRMSVGLGLSGNMSFVADLGDAALHGLAEGIFDARGLTTTKDGRIFMTGKDTGKIYELDVDGGFTIAEIAAGLDYATRIEYNRFNDTLVFVQQHVPAGVGQISQINLDGTGLVLLTDDAIVSPRDLYIIPSPSTLALIGVGGLFASRRRR